MNNFFVSICIPAYNRPEKLRNLLASIDGKNFGEIEIVICEDVSPKREEIRRVVDEFTQKTAYSVVYHENKKNLDYDGNLRELVRRAHGEWLIFMGDDDEFIPGAIDKLISFIKHHKEIAYVLRRYIAVRADGGVEDFRYYSGDRFFEPGKKTYEELFRKSVFISGFSIKRELILPYLIDNFDGSGLMQVYWVGELLLVEKAAYFDEPITKQIEDMNYRAQEVMYSHKEKKMIARPVSLDRSIDFLAGYSKVAKFLDKKHNFSSLPAIQRDLSKYSYPSLSVHRDKGIKIFLQYVTELNKLGFNITIYYYMYVVFLLVFGKRICDLGIRLIKKILGKTPNL